MKPSALTASFLARLRAKFPPTASSVWDDLPHTRRAAVLLLISPNLSTTLTLRSAELSSFSNQVALPGGKADDEAESAYSAARREAWEEIGLPLKDTGIEHIATLPVYLARNMLAVRPVVAYDPHLESRVLNPNADEVAEVFECPLEDFLKSKREPEGKEWHTVTRVGWGGLKWDMHSFGIRKNHKVVGEDAYMR